jgi:serine/threonine protein kinase
MQIDGSFQLQDIVDQISQHDELLKLDLSVTVADPLQQDCPLIACSNGFTELTGYTVAEIVGRNCRFLLNGVPDEYIDEDTRLRCRHYVAATKGSPGDPTPDETITEYLKTQPWMTTRPGEVICVQTNATKTGELFRNMFYMKQVELNDRPFILGLQAKLPEAWQDAVDQAQLVSFCEQAFARLGGNMRAVEEVLSRHFWYSASARRQDAVKSVPPSFALQAGVGLAVLRGSGAARSPTAKEDDFGDASAKWSHRQVSNTSTTVTSGVDDIDVDESSWARYSTPGSVGSGRQPPMAPVALHEGFDAASVQPWPADRFETLGKIEDANRNQGSVCLMKTVAEGALVAVKQMPNAWIRESHQAFEESHPHETEQPWSDIGCNCFLNSVSYPYCMQLHGVFRDQKTTSVVTEFANGGDLFNWASDLKEQPGLERETRVKPLVKQILHSVQCLHNRSIVHGDLSMENVLLSSCEDAGSPQIRLIDFGAATTARFVTQRVTGKPSYQAPEMFDDMRTRDGFLSDAFSVGVLLYAMCLMDYPWLSTSEADKCFEYVKTKGFAAFFKKRKLPNDKRSMSEIVSPELCAMLAGLLEIDPSKRLTLGEDAFGSERSSVWDEPWMQ